MARTAPAPKKENRARRHLDSGIGLMQRHYSQLFWRHKGARYYLLSHAAPDRRLIRGFPMVKIIFQNVSFLAVDKPAGWLSVAGRGDVKDTVCLLHHLSKLLGKQVWPVHRLDQAVSGLILYALSAESHREASRWFEGREVRKRYEGLTEGIEFPAVKTEFQWHHRLLRGKKRAYEKPFGKMAETTARFEKEWVVGTTRLGLWALMPSTGRPHQLRFQLSRAGFPVWGDVLYGSKEKFPVPGAIALRSVELDLSKTNAMQLGMPPTLLASPLIDWIGQTVNLH